MGKEVVAYGYRPPKSDLNSTNHGPDARIDVYIADIGDDSLYGYCTTDDPNASPAYGFYDVSAYCVVDDDYSPSQFSGAASGIAALQVTLAHEFATPSSTPTTLWRTAGCSRPRPRGWRTRSTTTSTTTISTCRPAPSGRPDFPLDVYDNDFSSPSYGNQYGAFIFFRYLSERLNDPSIVRRIWERADGSPTGPDDFSVQAIDNALRSVAGIGFAAAFSAFAAVNAFPASFYEEGAAYPTPPIAGQGILTAGRQRLSGQDTLDHLTSAYHLLRPGAGVRANARLRVKLNLPPRSQGSRAVLVVVQTSGALRFVPVTLNGQGDGAATVGFGRGKVKAVLFVLANASTRYTNCYVGLPYACGGLPVDDGRVYRYNARLMQAGR